jgi:protein involved in polysaccharide export with SLBB domain
MKAHGGHKFLLYLLTGLLLVTTATAQQSPTDQGTAGTSTAAGERSASPLSVYSTLLSGMNLQQFYNRFLDAYIDPSQYIVGPGDGFTIFFTPSDIADISCEINSDGSLFIKSVGHITLANVSLKEALDKIRSEVGRVYAKSDYTVQMTTFRINRINIIGEVVQPGIYYAPAIWRASEVLGLAGGLTPQASLRQIKLTGYGADNPVDLVRFSVLGDRQCNPMACRGNLLTVPNRRDITGFVAVAGVVDKPGIFEYVPGDRLSDLIAYCGGALGSLDDIEAMVSDGGTEAVRLDGASTAFAAYEPKPGDHIRLAWKKDRRQFGTVVVAGAVMQPGRYPLTRENLLLKDLLQLCGGVSEDAFPELTQVYRRDLGGASRATTALLDQSESPADEVPGLAPDGGSRLTRLSLNPRLPRDPGDIPLMDGDSVFIPKTTGMVMVSGAVASPGLVPYRRGEGVEYYLRQAGGLGFDGDRGRMVVVNTLTGGTISAAEAGTLFDGEILYVPRKESPAKQ